MKKNNHSKKRPAEDPEQRFRNIVEAIPVGLLIYHLESDGRLVFSGSNSAAGRILGQGCGKVP